MSTTDGTSAAQSTAPAPKRAASEPKGPIPSPNRAAAGSKRAAPGSNRAAVGPKGPGPSAKQKTSNSKRKTSGARGNASAGRTNASGTRAGKTSTTVDGTSTTVDGTSTTVDGTSTTVDISGTGDTAAGTSTGGAVEAPPALPRLRRSAVPKLEPLPASRVLPWVRMPAQPDTQGTLALAMPTAFGPDSESWAEGIGEAGRRLAGRAYPDQGPADRRPTDPIVGLLPEPNAWAATFIQAAMEVAGGMRSAGQLIRWTTPEVHSMLVRRGALTARARRGTSLMGSKPRIRALLGCVPRPGVCEMSAVIAEPDRVRAVAFRMEGLHGRWRVTELQIG
jgi:hypothetical protein